MLSPNACRMGLVTTTRRQIGYSLLTSPSMGSRRALLTASSNSSLLVSGGRSDAETSSIWTLPRQAGNRRWKSTRMASAYDTDEDSDGSLDARSKGFEAAAQLRSTSSEQKLWAHEEAWMVNLGRGNDNEWLTGPREEEWFTGVHPRDCPGTSVGSPMECIGSLL
jgi:hypothetical protein